MESVYNVIEFIQKVTKHYKHTCMYVCVYAYMQRRSRLATEYESILSKGMKMI